MDEVYLFNKINNILRHLCIALVTFLQPTIILTILVCVVQRECWSVLDCFTFNTDLIYSHILTYIHI